MVGTMLQMMGAAHRTAANARADFFNRDQAYAEARETRTQTERAVGSAQTNEQQQLGSVRAAYGASGVTMSGTAQDVLASQAGVMNSKIQGIMESGLFKSKELEGQGAAYDQAGQDNISGGFLNQAAIGLGGAKQDIIAGMG